MKAKLGGRTWAALLTFGLVGQIAWVIENMYFNVFLYNTISGDTSMIAAMVAWSAVTATVTTLVMGALSDRLGRRKAFIRGGLSAVGRQHRGLCPDQKQPRGRCRPQRGGAGGGAGLRYDLLRVHRQRRSLQRWGHRRHRAGKPGPVETVLAIMPLVAMLVVFGALDGLTQAGSWRLFFLIVGGVTELGGVLGFFFIREPGPAPGPGDHILQPSVRLPSRRCPGQPAAVSVPGGAGGILHEPAGVYAVSHYLYPAVLGICGLHVPAGPGY